MDWPWNPWKIHGICESTRTPHGLPGGVISPPSYDIRFEKRYIDGGSMSVFGSGLVPGMNPYAHEFVWHYYDQEKKCVVPVPHGFVPTLDPQYLDTEDPLFEPPPANYRRPHIDEEEMNQDDNDGDTEL